MRTQKALEIVPSNPTEPFLNASDPQYASFGYCYQDINCKTGTCCGSYCCPHRYAKCCNNGCCKGFLQKCCGPVKKNGRQWCCDSDERCGTYVEGLCMDNSSSLVPQFLMVFAVATMRIWLLKVFDQ